MVDRYPAIHASILKRFDELVASGMTEDEARLHLKIKRHHSSIYKSDETSATASSNERIFLGSFVNALNALRSGKKVRRSEARWFVSMVDNRICMYALDGANNAQFKGIATFTSPDVLAYDWQIKT
jgi:hypothetical protein